VNAGAIAELVLSVTEEGVVAFDGNLVCTYWSPVMERLFGITAESAVGRVLPASLTSPSSATHDAPLARVLAGEDVHLEGALAAAKAGGSPPLTYDARYVPWRAVTGAVEGGVGVLRDTSQRRRAEQRALETESRFRIMADVAPVLLWMAGPDALCTFFNQTWLDFTGRTLEQEWGVGWAEGVHFEDFQRCIDTYMAAFAERRTFEMEYRLRRADGQYRWVLDRGTPRWESDGRFAGYIGSCADITDRKDLELELLNAVRVRDEFLSIASHELRTPLTALRLRLDSVARSLEHRAPEHLANGRLAASAGDAQSQVARLTTLVERLLDISRFAEGRLALEREELDLVPVVRAVLEAMREPARLNGCELRLTAPRAMRGCWDRVRLEQLVTNLVGNAMKFGARHPVDVLLEEVAEPSPGAARLLVADRGIGIDPQYQRRIFGRFERAVSARHFGGLGLGLWVAKQIVDAHEGTISVESAPGEGATFTIVLPTAAAPRLARRSA
jgi:PAS domain S-box-containing protein